MDNIFIVAISYVLAGGPGALIVLLLLGIAFLVWDRKKLNEIMKEKQNDEAESIKEIVERYHQGNLNMIQALNEIKIVLSTIQITYR